MTKPMELRTEDGRLIGCPADTFHGLSDVERAEAIGFLAQLGGYAWPPQGIVYTSQVMLDAEKVAAALRITRWGQDAADSLRPRP